MASPAFYRSTSRDAETEVEIHLINLFFFCRQEKKKKRDY